MHRGNQDFLRRLVEQYPSSFVGARVLELGSLDMCGSVRPFFIETSRYVGVDIVAGPGVDIVVPACETVFQPEEFDTLISFSMFEHDPTWKKSYLHNLQWLRPGGMIFLSWGAEGNGHHLPEPFAIVPVADFNAATTEAGCVEIIEQFFENVDCAGCYDVVARKR